MVYHRMLNIVPCITNGFSYTYTYILFLNFLFCIGIQPMNNVVIASGDQLNSLLYLSEILLALLTVGSPGMQWLRVGLSEHELKTQASLQGNLQSCSQNLCVALRSYYPSPCDSPGEIDMDVHICVTILPQTPLPSSCHVTLSRNPSAIQQGLIIYAFKMYPCVHVILFQIFFSIMVCHRILNIILCAKQQGLAVSFKLMYLSFCQSVSY